MLRITHEGSVIRERDSVQAGHYAEFALKAGKEGAYDAQTLKAVEEDTYSSIIQSLK